MSQRNRVSNFTKGLIGWDFALGGWNLHHALELYGNGQPMWALLLVVLAVALFAVGWVLLESTYW